MNSNPVCLSTCLSVSTLRSSLCYVRAHGFMFSENKITTLAQGPGSLRYSAHRSNSRETFSKFLVKDVPYAQKWHSRYKNIGISETKKSRAKVTTDCL